MSREIYRRKKKNQDEEYWLGYQNLKHSGLHGNMDEYAEEDGYFGGISPFYGDLEEEKVDTEAIDKEFDDRYSKLMKLATKALTPDQYRIFEMYFVKCDSQQSIAKRLNVSQQYVAKASTRILEILRLHEGEVY